MGVISDFITSKLDGSGASLAHAKYLLDKIQTMITQINELTTFTVFNRAMEFAQGLSITGTTPSTTPGAMWWNSTASWMSIASEYPDAVLNIGHEAWVNVENNIGTPLTDGTIVYLDGYAGEHHFYVKKALADSLDTARVLGVITNPIADGSRGKCTVFGGIHGLNTFGEISGAEVYLSDSVAGEWTTTKPAIPIRIGYIGDVDATNGSFIILIDEKPPSIFASVYSDISQSYDGTNSEVVTFNKEFKVIGIEHSTTVNPENLKLLSSGTYVITANFEVYRILGSSAEDYRAWLQISTDNGSTWTNIPFTNIKASVYNIGTTNRLSANVGVHFDVNDILRVTARASTANLELRAIASGVSNPDEPAQASVMFSMYRLGD